MTSAIVQQNAPASNQTQDFTSAGLGTPKIALMFGNEVSSFNVDADDLNVTIGAADGTTEGCYRSSYEDNVATADAKSEHRNDCMFIGADAGSDTREETAVFDSFITNGVRVDWTDTSVAKEVSMLMLAGCLESAEVINLTHPGTGTEKATCSFIPDIVLCFNGTHTAINTGLNQCRTAIGWYDRINNTYGNAISYGEHNTPVSSHVAACRHDNGSVGGQVNTGNGALANGFTLSNFVSNGFDVTKISSTATVTMTFVALKLASGYSVASGSFNAPTSTGVDNTLIAGLPFTPETLLLSAVNVDTVNQGSIAESSWMFGAATATAEFALGHYIAKVAINTNSLDWHRDNLCGHIVNSAGLVRSSCSLDAFNADNVGLDFSVADDDIVFNYLVIGPTGSGGQATLTSPTDAAVSWDKAQGTVTSDTLGGNIYGVVTQSATTPSHAQIVAGQDHTGAAADAATNQVAVIGVNTLGFTGLSQSTAYYIHFSQSTTTPSVPVSGDGFTTSANQAPVVVTPIPDQVCVIGQPFGPLFVGANFSDPDGDTLQFSQSGLPNGLTISSDGFISGTPTGGYQ